MLTQEKIDEIKKLVSGRGPVAFRRERSDQGDVEEGPCVFVRYKIMGMISIAGSSGVDMVKADVENEIEKITNLPSSLIRSY